jgi:hypothetical protein
VTCRRALKDAALAAGGDLPSRRRRRLEKHLATCPACREEFRRIRDAIAGARSLARAERTPDWPEAEWRRAIARAAGQKIKKSRRFPAGLPRWAWAGAAALLILALIGAGVLFVRRGPRPTVFVERAGSTDIVLPEGRSSSPARVEPVPPLRGGAARHPETSAGPPSGAGTVRTAYPGSPPGRPSPSKVDSLTFVSQETGLTIHWFFNDKFDYKEKAK